MTNSSQEAASGASKDVPVGTEQQSADSGEAPNDDQVPAATNTATANDVPGEWCKIFCSKESNEAGQEYYFSNLQTGESKWEEPDAEYWLWDHGTGTYHVSGLQKPTSKETLAKEKKSRENEKGPLPYDDKDPANGWQGYNPKVHGTYDKNAPYTAYHNFLEWEKASKENPQAAAAQAQGGFQTYESVANFNSHTGRFQAGDQTADRYSADNKAGRQMNAFFDVDTAANSHDGRSLKEERRNTKLSKKEIQEMNQKRKDKKQAKRMAFLKS